MIDQRIKTMTVNQLIEKLQALPADQKELVVAHYDDLEEAYNLPTKVELKHFYKARGVRGDYPWLWEPDDSRPDEFFIEIS